MICFALSLTHSLVNGENTKERDNVNFFASASEVTKTHRKAWATEHRLLTHILFVDSDEL